MTITWHPLWGGNFLQVTLGERKDLVVFVEFSAEGTALNGTVFRNPFVVPQNRFVNSPMAVAFRENGEFAKCAQQALFDAGFDPNGVDGAPGNGARQALAAWSDANGITMPSFTRETTPQVCYVLTAAVPVHADLQVGVMIGFPGITANGFTQSTGGTFQGPALAGVNVVVRYEGETVRQIDAFDFGPGIIFQYEGPDGTGNQINVVLDAPWPIVGKVVTHGSDTPRPQSLFELMDTERGTAEFAQSVIDGQAGGYNGLRDDLYHRPDEIDARWTVIGNLNEAGVVVLDAAPSRSLTGDRVVIIFTDAGSGGGQLLYAWHNRQFPDNLIRALD